jgi:DNA invertase Pin-like site-specific DNA recombinase
MNAVIYARYSPGPNQTEQSIEGQLLVCHEYAKREGISIVGEYIDRKLSGRAAEHRLEFQRMIDDSQKKQFQAVLVYQLDRFARDRHDSAIYKHKLKRLGVRVMSARENISDDPSGILMESVLEGMAEYYSAELALKINRGMGINASKCLSNGGRIPLGYRVDSEKRFQIDEETAPIVQKVFEMVAAGETYRNIIGYLNALHLKTSLKNEFNKNSLHRMLANRRYLGIYIYKGEETPGGMPQIISEELFNKVGGILNINKKARARAKADEPYILTTKLFCGHCREMMTGISGTSKTGSVYYYYVCNNSKKKLCDKKSVRKHVIESRVLEEARKQLTDESIEIIVKEAGKISARENENHNLKRLNRLLKENITATENLLIALEQGQGAEAITERIAKRQAEKNGLEARISTEKINSRQIDPDEIRFFLDVLKKSDVNDLKYQQLLITVFVNRVYLYDDNRMTIVFNDSNKPVSVDVQLLDEIAKNVENSGLLDGSAVENKSSFIGADRPPQESQANPLPTVYMVGRGFVLVLPISAAS